MPYTGKLVLTPSESHWFQRFPGTIIIICGLFTKSIVSRISKLSHDCLTKICKLSQNAGVQDTYRTELDETEGFSSVIKLYFQKSVFFTVN